jgi:hypothetical protein
LPIGWRNRAFSFWEDTNRLLGGGWIFQCDSGALGNGKRLGIAREAAPVRPSVIGGNRAVEVGSPASVNAAPLLRAVEGDLGDLTDRLRGDGQPLAVRVESGREVFGVLFVGSA